MIPPVFTANRFGTRNMKRAIDRNLNSYAQNCFRLPLLARVAYRLRDALHRCYGQGWSGRAEAMMSEPKWLVAVWRWCGIPFLGFQPFRTPRIESFFTKKIVQDPDGSWWCETTYTPPACFGLDLRDIIMSNMLKDVGVPQDMFVVEVTGRTMGKTMRAEALARLTQRAKEAGLKFHMVDHDFAAAERKFVGGVDWGYHGDKQANAVIQGGKAYVPELFGLPIRIVPREALPEGVDAVVGNLPKPGEKIEPHKFVIVKSRTPEPMKPSHSILILRRSDLLPTRENVPFNQIELPDFRQRPQELDAATDIVFIDGVRQKVLKQPDSTRGVRPYMASYFHPSRHDQQVIDGRLVSSFPDDEPLGIKAGTLICEPWTEEDSANVDPGNGEDPGDDVMGSTVTRHGVLFHDRGVFIPATSR